MIARVETRPARGPRDVLTWVVRGITYVVLLAFTFAVAFPLVAMLFDSFKTQYQIYADPWGVPSSLVWDNWAYAWNAAQIPRFIGNSAIVAAGTVCLTLLLASMAAYGFTAFRF